MRNPLSTKNIETPVPPEVIMDTKRAAFKSSNCICCKAGNTACCIKTNKAAITRMAFRFLKYTGDVLTYPSNRIEQY